MRMQSPTVSDEMPRRFRINESARHRWTRMFLMKCEEAVCLLWVAPALQVFSVDVCGHFRQYRRLSGLFMFWHCLHWP